MAYKKSIAQYPYETYIKNFVYGTTLPFMHWQNKHFRMA